MELTDSDKSRTDSATRLMQYESESNNIAQRSFENWLIAVIQAHYSMNGETMKKMVVDSWRDSLTTTSAYHTDMAGIMSDDKVLAKSHQILASIYSALAQG